MKGSHAAMSFTINPNFYAGQIATYLNQTTNSLAASIGHLSSGLRINSAADDPAGLAISMQLTSQINGLTQAAQNAQSGISLAQTADGALTEVSSILQRMNTLAVQASNGTNTPTDVQALQSEMNQLTTEMNQITNTTAFNGINLLGGGFQNQSFFVGANAGSTLSLSLRPMDAASLGLATSAANLNQGQNAADVQSLSMVGSGLQGNNEQYQIASTTMTGGAGANIFNTSGAASTTLTATPNQGNEAMTLAITGGTFTGATANYQVRVTSVNPSGTITGVEYSTSTGSTPTWTQAAVSAGAGGAPTFSFGSGITATFANNAATPQVGDQFAFNATNGAATAAVQATMHSGANIGNETASVSNTYTGTSNQQYVVRASQEDTNNNVVGIQVSTDGGKTFSSTITATGYVGVAFAPGTAATFTGTNLNGMTVTWNQSTFNANQVATNGDSFAFNVVASGQSAQLLQLSDVTQVGGVAKFSGAAANIGQSVMVSGSQTAATVGTGQQVVTANFAAPGATGGLASGDSVFTVATSQAAVFGGNGQLLSGATAGAGPDISTPAAASAAITQIANALTSVSNEQSTLGATQNSLTDIVNVDTTSQQNLTSANSTIMDVNVAQELVHEMQLKIQQQAQIALLAQSNQIPNVVQTLLG
jgi:flagellin